jgi:riboflavin synthase alpha subunit
MVNTHIDAKKPVVAVEPDESQNHFQEVGNQVLQFIIHRGVIRTR